MLPSSADGSVKPPADPVEAIASLSMPAVSTLNRIDTAYQLEPGTAAAALHTGAPLAPADQPGAVSFQAADLARHIDFAAALAEKAHINIGSGSTLPNSTAAGGRTWTRRVVRAPLPREPIARFVR